jgi:hypothetical protein
MASGYYGGGSNYKEEPDTKIGLENEVAVRVEQVIEQKPVVDSTATKEVTE